MDNNTHHGPYERNCPYLWPPFDPISPNWAEGQNVKMQALKSIKDLFKHKDSSRLHFGHRWLTHFKCANGFSKLFHAFFRCNFILGHGAYQWSSSLARCTSCIVHFVFMCRSLTFLSHLDNPSFLFLPISFDKFRQESYVGMWGHYGLKVMRIYSGLVNGALGPTANFLWWYRLFICGKLYPIYFSREFGFGGFISMI
jgi:hypothetical protein